MKALGIQKNLKTLTVDIGVTERLAPQVPADRIVVAESGLSSRADLDRMAAVGPRCFLMGEALMRRPDVAAATRSRALFAARAVCFCWRSAAETPGGGGGSRAKTCSDPSSRSTRRNAHSRSVG